MIRAFLALPLPDPLLHSLTVAQHRLRLDAPVPPENFHVTLAFLGDQREPVLEELHAILETRALPMPTLRLDGLGVFGGAKPRNIHAAIAPDPALTALHGKVAAAARDAGIKLEGRKYVPHVTLARFAPGTGPAPALAAAIQSVGAVTSQPHAVDTMRLYRSTLRRGGAVYDPLAEYPLGR